MIPTSGNDREAQKKSPFPSGKPRKSIENGSSNPGRKIVALSRRFPTEKIRPGTDRFLAVLSDAGTVQELRYRNSLTIGELPVEQ
jgi:hypothetical protein